MSEAARLFESATPVPVWTRPNVRRFAAVAPANPSGFSAWAGTAEEEAEPTAPAIDSGATSLIEQGYALGLAEGRRVAEATLEQERAALANLAASLEVLQPEPPAALAAMLAHSVRRLVAQIVGEVEIDEFALAERTFAVAAQIAEDSAPSRLRLNPADAARLADVRLPLAVTPDGGITPGAVVLETGNGWIEDSPAVRLEKLRTALDRMGAPR